MKKSAFFHAVLALVCCHHAITATAAVVSFGFGGKVSYFDNASNALPANITVGTPFSGIAGQETPAAKS